MPNEVARLEAAELHALGFRLVSILGTPALFWERDRGHRTLPERDPLASAPSDKEGDGHTA